MPTQLAAFCVHGYYGLCSLTDQILAPEYQAVWPMLAGRFWGYRWGEVFGVLSADGTEVIDCVVPARYPGYQLLSGSEELRALQVPEARFLSHLCEQYPALKMQGSSLCLPGAWFVEDITPCLEKAHRSLCFETTDFALLLWADGTWTWKPPSAVPVFKPVVLATAGPVTFSLITPHSFSEASTARLLNWRLRYHSPAGTSGEQWERDIDAKVAMDYDRLANVPTGAPEWWEVEEAPMYLTFELWHFPAPVLSVCVHHLQRLVEASPRSGPLMERLVYLAWLWANAFVHKTYLPPYYVVDARYIVDTTWFNGLPIQEVYLRYELNQLESLLVDPLSRKK